MSEIYHMQIQIKLIHVYNIIPEYLCAFQILAIEIEEQLGYGPEWVNN